MIRQLLFYLFSSLFPRRPTLWAFGSSGDSFIDNTKYLFLWVSANCPDIEAVWITPSHKIRSDLRAKGYRAELRGTAAAKLIALRAKLHLYSHVPNDVYFSWSGGCLHINLWHGIGIKQTFYGEKISPHAKFCAMGDKSLLFRLKHWGVFYPSYMVLSTSETMSQHFSKCFRVPVERCPQIGYPRLDVATDENLRRQALAFGDYTSLNQAFEAFDKVYLYMPTFRDSGHDFLKDAFPDLRHLSQLLASKNAVFYVKLHPFTEETFPTEFDNLRKWPDGLDIYPVLNRFDVLITDYSSILYDWIFSKDNGVILYTFDYDSYTKIDRDFAFPFEENTIGVKAANFEDLCAVLQTDAGLAALPKEKLAILRERFWGEMQPLASSRLTDYLKELASSK